MQTINKDGSDFWRRLKKNKSAMIGLIILVLSMLLAIFADIIANYETKAILQNIPNQMQPPGSEHILGTDEYGRDIFARLIHGARVSLIIGFSSTAISLCIGSALGAFSGYKGGKTDNAIMRIMDTILCIPPMLLALAVVAALGQGILNLIIALTLSHIPSFAKVTRSAILSVVDQDFIESAKTYGASVPYILRKHVLPNALGTIIVDATTEVSSVILIAASMSFIGMGIVPPRPEWGGMLSEAREFMRIAPHLVLAPGIALVSLSLSINLLGDGLRDALDPKLKN